ncbi:MAG: hypothetical protein J1F11_05095 [Oscillospiraceae bacterium]|nr:hypothetical protein [Oscillospiraceae bacterium]
MFTKLDKYFTDRKKGYFALGALAFIPVWMFFWNAFPMQFYSFFFAGVIGSNIQLVLLDLVVLFPMLYIFTKLTRTDLSFSKTVLMNIFLMVAMEYVFSVFYFREQFYFCVIAYIIHSAVNVLTFGSAGVRDRKAGKGMRAPEAKREAAIKKQPVLSIVWAAAFSFVSDAAGIGLMYIIARIYAY